MLLMSAGSHKGSRADTVLCAAEQAWQAAAASAGLAEPPALYSRRRLVAMAGCDRILQQHAQSCASILAGRFQVEDHDQHPQPSARPQPWAFSARLTDTATASASASIDGDAAVHLSQPRTAAPRILPVPRRRQPAWDADDETDFQIRHVSFSPTGSHIALVCYQEHLPSDDSASSDGLGYPKEEGGDESENMQLRVMDLATGQVAYVTAMPHLLCVDWAPDGCTFVVQGGSGTLIANTSGTVLRWDVGPLDDDAVDITWRPDSSGFYASLACGYLYDYPAQGGRVRAVQTRDWVCQAAAFLPYRQYGHLWVVLALMRPREGVGYLALQPEGDLEASPERDDYPDVDEELLPYNKIGTAGACHSLAVSAQHVAVLCGPEPGRFGCETVHLYTIRSHGDCLDLFYRTYVPFHTHTPYPAIALSTCGVFVAIITADRDSLDRKRSLTGEPRPRSGLLHMQYLPAPACCIDSPLSVSTVLSEHLMQHRPSLQWASDSSALAVTASHTDWSGPCRYRVHTFS